MPYFAHMTLMGHVGRITRSISTSGKPYVEMSIAVTSQRTDKNGERITSWFNIIFFGNNLEWIDKGDLVMVDGEPLITQYNDKYYTRVIASRVLKVKGTESTKVAEGNSII